MKKENDVDKGEASPEKAHIDRKPEVEGTGAVPPCVVAGSVLCRGCPGWIDMKKALLERRAGWEVIHCSAIGLTVRRAN